MVTYRRFIYHHRRHRHYHVRAFNLLLLVLVLFFMHATASRFELSSFGQVRSDIVADTALVQRAIDSCASVGGGTVVVPAGPPITIATVVLKSHVELHLARGATLRGSPRHADFTRHSPWPIAIPPGPLLMSGVIIYAEDAEDVALTGPGTIDGNGSAYVNKQGTEIHQCPNARPFSVVFTRCRHITVRDLVLRDSAFWTLRLLGCDDALIDGVRILGDMLMPNNDGIDIDWSSNVRISGCHIATGDDCISLKTSPASAELNHPSENIVVTNCTLRSRSSGIAVGCDVQGVIRDAVFSDCVITDSHRGVAVRLSCDGSIECVQFNNMVIETHLFDDRWWGRGEPIHVLALPWTNAYHNGVIRDLRFTNLDCRGENGVVIVSNEPGHIQGISFDRVTIHIAKKTEWDGRRQDFRPNEIEAMPEIPVSGFLVRHGRDVTWRDCRVTWGARLPAYYRHALDAQGCAALAIAGLQGVSADPSRWPAHLVR